MLPRLDLPASLKTRRSDTVKVLSSRQRVVALVGVILALTWFGLTAPSQELFLANTIAITTVAAVGLNTLMGTAGIISLGHGAFVAVGAFTAAGLSLERGWGLLPSIAAGTVLATLLGLVAAILALRLRGLYVALVTLGAHFIVVYGAREYQSQVSQGAGLELQGSGFLKTDRDWFIALVVVTGAVLVLFTNLLRTRWGRAFQAVRDRDVAAAITGVNVDATKLRAFALSSGLAGLAGGLLAHYLGTVSIEQFGLVLSIQYVAVVVIGGTNSVLGTVLGASFVTLLPRWVDFAVGRLPEGGFVERLETSIFDLKAAMFGIAIVLFLILEPQGLVAVWGKARQYFAMWPFSRRRSVIEGPR